MKTLLIVNDIIWIITAILCVFFDNTIITTIVIVTTVVYAIDLFIKFKKLNWNVKQFFKQYWLDILFLIPICKIFRGFRIVKTGRLLRIADATNDFTEMVFRLMNFLKHNKKM